MNELLKTLKDLETKIISSINETMSSKHDELRAILHSYGQRVEALEAHTATFQQRDLIWDRKFRRNNILLFGIDECPNDVLLDNTLSILNGALELELTINNINNIYRLGKMSENKTRPVLVEMVSNLCKITVLRNAHKLKDTQYSISQDRTHTDKQNRKQLLSHQKQARELSLNTRILNDNKLMINGEIYTLEQLNKGSILDVASVSHQPNDTHQDTLLPNTNNGRPLDVPKGSDQPNVTYSGTSLPNTNNRRPGKNTIDSPDRVTPRHNTLKPKVTNSPSPKPPSTASPVSPRPSSAAPTAPPQSSTSKRMATSPPVAPFRLPSNRLKTQDKKNLPKNR